MEKELPKNWVETDLDTIVLRMSNGSGLKQFEEEFEGAFPISRIETIWNETIDLDRVKYVKPTEDDVEKYSLQKGDVLFSHINSDKHLGKTAVYNLDIKVIHGINLLLLRPCSQFNGNLLNYLLRHYRFSGKFIEVAQRAVNQSSINQKKLKSFSAPLIPLPEQTRMVDKLDQLFGQLEQINESLDIIPQLLKDFRQQILTQAITGKLTEEWREESNYLNSNEIIHYIFKERTKNVSTALLKKLKDIYEDEESSIDFNVPPEWIEVNLDKVCNSFDYGTSSKSDNFGKYPVLRMGNMQNGKLDWSDLKYTSDIKEYEKYKLNHGNVLFNRTNSPELVGKTSIYLGEFDSLFAGYLIRIDNRKELNSKFLNYVLNSHYAKEWCWNSKTDGVSQSNINATKLSKFTIPYPSIQEQEEIVRRVEVFFTKADTIEQQYQTLKQKIETLPQAILHKAFKGELVPQLASDGDARELLEEIKALKKKN